MSLHFTQEITDGVLLSRLGEVHRDRGRLTECGNTIHPRQAVAVSHVQAVVHKLRVCHVCYPGHAQGGRHVR